MAMASAFYDSCVLFTASDLGVFAKLAELGQANADTLAVALKTDARGLRLLLDAGVALELLKKEGDAYSNAPDAALFLVPGSPADLSKAIRYNRDVYPAWGKLPELVKAGRPVESPELHLGDDPARTRTFVMSMHFRALGIGRAVIPHVDLAGCRQLLDPAGGPGTYSVLMAQANPGLSCTVLDLPEVAKIAGELIQQQGMSESVKTLPGDYHSTPFPGGNDAVTFFGCLHQESPDAIVALFRKAHASLVPGGRIFVMDMMTDATHANPRFSALFAVNMALTTQNGWVFSDVELKGWLEQAGFTGFSVKPLPPPIPHWLAMARRS
jgi:SAM-dependent methyltransferase